MMSLVRKSKSLAWRCAHPFAGAIMRCTEPHPAPPSTGGRLLDVGANDAAGCDLAKDTMRSCGEAFADIERRFAIGDRFFAWMVDEAVASFCWVTTAGRPEVGFWIAEAPDRAVVYNVFTPEAYRGRSMATRLLRHVTHVLAREGRRDLVAGVSLANKPSFGALSAAGFRQVAVSRCVLVFGRIRILQRLERCDPSARVLFAPRGAEQDRMSSDAGAGT